MFEKSCKNDARCDTRGWKAKNIYIGSEKRQKNDLVWEEKTSKKVCQKEGT